MKKFNGKKTLRMVFSFALCLGALFSCLPAAAAAQYGVPATGDINDIGLWIAVAGAGILVLLIFFIVLLVKSVKRARSSRHSRAKHTADAPAKKAQHMRHKR